MANETTRMPITQQDYLGCGVACVAYASDRSYADIFTLLKADKEKAAFTGFFCRELLSVLNINGQAYSYHYIKPRLRRTIYRPGAIVFIQRSKSYPNGHFLCRTPKGWMDPWFNYLQNDNVAAATSGIRKRLPGKPIYILTPVFK